jgi:hypothetical protein
MIGAADKLLSNPKAVDEELRKSIDAKTEEWGIVVKSVEIRDVPIPAALQDVMSREAQAERERQARVILGAAEAEIAHSFAEATRSYADNPVALHLRGMNMLYESVKERCGTIIVPRHFGRQHEPRRRCQHHVTGEGRRNRTGGRAAQELSRLSLLDVVAAKLLHHEKAPPPLMGEGSGGGDSAPAKTARNRSMWPWNPTPGLKRGFILSFRTRLRPQRETRCRKPQQLSGQPPPPIPPPSWGRDLNPGTMVDNG